ncbi:thioredoxin domain-containing protein 5 homolog [Argiope bruennichi]|uniref:Thioredoxin domain-containing protein 5 n=1 Tax=Argiope bruennichi TaxID=94029 RepID=A0A8T0F849_ARGBR|nr:thioredoxin domain-containing protein 5 homolog [Argiope bruennichi]KAF8787031.1 Thioredoxin domain-containing protein 5 [Argiope bruennichi]
MDLKCTLPVVLSVFLLKVCLGSDLYSDKVLKYDSQIFKQKIGGDKPHFVNFFAPWCGYCKRLKPVWDELAEKYNVDSNNQELVIAKVDCTVETPICADEGVSGYPSLIYYEAGQSKGTKYQGKRDLVGLEDFISNNLGQKKTDEPEKTRPIISGKGALELTDETFQNTVNWGMHFVKFYAPWCGHCQRMAHAWEELAENLEHDKSVTISKVDCTENKKTCADFEVKGYPTLLWIINGKKIEKYQGARNLDSFKQFINEMKIAHKDAIDEEEGRIPDPKNEPNLVVELSEDNFENAVKQEISFVKFFVPWCGHCKRLEPIWNDLAIKFSSNPKVKIAKVDCTQQEKLCAEHKIIGYPTLFIFHNGKFMTEYHGERKLENLHSFVLEYLQHSEL